MEGTDVLPSDFILESNYPNPFNPSTTIRFGLPYASDVVLDIYTVEGREVATLIDRHLDAGWHETIFEANAIPSGLYVCRLKIGTVTRAITMVLMR